MTEDQGMTGTDGLPRRRTMNRITTVALAAAIILLCIGCDRVSKHIAADTLRGAPPVAIAAGTIILSYTENAGALLSLGANLSDAFRFWILTVGVGLLLAAILGYLLFAREIPPIRVTALALVCGGGASNLYDRLINEGRVVDFVSIGVGSIRTGVFNVADVAITAGACCLLLAALGKQKPRTGQT